MSESLPRRSYFRRRKPVPRIVVKSAWTIRDPAVDAREADAEVRAWIARAVAPIPTAWSA